MQINTHTPLTNSENVTCSKDSLLFFSPLLVMQMSYDRWSKIEISDDEDDFPSISTQGGRPSRTSPAVEFDTDLPTKVVHPAHIQRTSVLLRPHFVFCSAYLNFPGMRYEV